MNWMKSTIVAAAIGAASCAAADDENTLVMKIAGESAGTVEIELFEDVAPGHVEQIKVLVRLGAYDKVVFHRVIDGFMAQTGDIQFGNLNEFIPEAVGRGSWTEGETTHYLKAEFSDIPYERGVVGMARSQHPNSASSQFFIMFADAPFLNGQYTVIGRVKSGQDVVDAIKKGDPNRNGEVVDPDYMVQVRVKADM